MEEYFEFQRTKPHIIKLIDRYVKNILHLNNIVD